MKRPARVPSRLSEFLHHRLNAYALAASAAGAGTLALAQPAEAKIVYTAAHVTIGFGGVSTYKLDLNHDGITDVRILESETGTSGGRSNCLCAAPARGNAIVGYRSVYRSDFASALKRGATIDGRLRFLSHGKKGEGMVRTQTASGTASGLSNGAWVNVSNRFLAIRFKIRGKTHYGWARLSVKIEGFVAVRAVLTGYAYETIPNKPIIADQEHSKDDASLGRLAQGASGVAAWRHE